MMLGMFASVSLCMLTVLYALLVSKVTATMALWRSWIVETCCDLVADVVQSSVC